MIRIPGLKSMLGAAAGAVDSIRFAVTDVEGLEVEMFPVTGRTAAAEAIRAKKVGFVLTGPAELASIDAHGTFHRPLA